MFDSLHIVESAITAEAEIEEVAFWGFVVISFQFPMEPKQHGRCLGRAWWKDPELDQLHD